MDRGGPGWTGAGRGGPGWAGADSKAWAGSAAIGEFDGGKPKRRCVLREGIVGADRRRHARNA
ncbi:hypothetical protein SBD_5954 [Streptomyces bottropensis ATCC 25435]|uniref:Uncharacterized protein n=1 Tax=Streptomyces bottropensis ATCC 25435 TaxID=1054862 RepID=M3EUR9_9ACTN|nr:hypothetical protein SBD_5954 [Streptomyces bottropensis ATCC 25435]